MKSVGHAFAITLIWVAFFTLIGLVIWWTKALGVLWALLLMGMLPYYKEGK